MPQVAAKRSFHSKSKRGCFRCKQRHTKCDEVHPVCGHCTRISAECNWPNQSSQASSNHPSPNYVSTPQDAIQSINTKTLGDTSPSGLALDDMKLLHHWTTKLSFTHDSEHGPGVRLWSVDVVEVAFEYPFLLRGLLATAAIHKTLEDPQANRASLLLQADTHISSALVVYREHLEKPTLETALPMFLFAAFLFTYNLASAQVEGPNQTLDGVLHCFRLIQGIRVVITGYWEYLKTLPVVVGSLHGLTEMQAIPLPEAGGFSEILDLKQLASELDASDGEVCIRTIESLHLCFLRTQTLLQSGAGEPYHNCQKLVHHLFINWAVMLDRAFLDLITAHNPTAVIIVAHYAVLVSQARYAWWVSGWPERIMSACISLLETRPEYRPWLDWPLRQMAASA